MKIKVLLATAASIVIFFTNASAQSSTTTFKLQTAIDIALVNNIPVKQKELEIQAARANYNQAKYERLPAISGQLNYGINNGRSIDPFTNSYNTQQLSSSNGDLSASVPLFSGFQISNSIKQNQLTYKAVQMETQQEKDALLLNVILAFLQVLNNEDILALSRQQALVTHDQVNRLEILNSEGAIAPAQFFDMKGQYATDQLAIVNAANALESSKLSLAQLMNIPYSKEMQLDREGLNMSMELYTQTPAELYRSALEKLAMVKAADLRSNAASKGIKVAAADFYPTISFFGQLSSNYSSAARNFISTGVSDVPSGDYVFGTNDPVITKKETFRDQKISYFNQFSNNLNTYVGVSLQVPIFNAFRSRTRVALARIEARNAGYIAENTRIQLKQSIEKAHLDMTAAYDKYVILQEQVTAFKESFRSAEIRFGLGAINSVEYLIVKNNLDRSGLNLTTARYEYLLRTKVLDFYQGNLK